MNLTDLTAGTRIRHLTWDSTGTVRIAPGGLVVVSWDGSFVEDEIGEYGPVHPEDVEIIPDGALPPEPPLVPGPDACQCGLPACRSGWAPADSPAGAP